MHSSTNVIVLICVNTLQPENPFSAKRLVLFFIHSVLRFSSSVFLLCILFFPIRFEYSFTEIQMTTFNKVGPYSLIKYILKKLSFEKQLKRLLLLHFDSINIEWLVVNAIVAAVENAFCMQPKVMVHMTLNDKYFLFHIYSYYSCEKKSLTEHSLLFISP